ncbi:MAG: DUF2207 domain-containing protein [Bacilli bacterium]
MKKIVSTLAFLFLFLLPLKINALEDTNLIGNGEYAITNYNIDIKVNMNNSFSITENISTHFSIEKHGIIRTIPLINNVTRLDGSKYTNFAKITNIKVNEQFTSSKSSKKLKLKIGDPNQFITEDKTYNISYLYSLGQDKTKDFDELYFNIIGTEWDTTISNVNFTITMPKDFDESKIGFSSGEFGSIDKSKVFYTVQDNTIKGEYRGVVNPKEAVTIRLQLEEGYFNKPGFNYSIILIFLIPFIGLFIAIILYLLHGIDKKVIETVEFYPPEGHNSLDLAFLYKGYVENKDIISLLIYLANKGYLTIEETIPKDNFLFTKLKDYDGNNEEEKIFFDGLFDFYKRKEVTLLDLKNEFYKSLIKIKNVTESKENKNKIYEKKSIFLYIIPTILLIISVLTLMTVPTLEYAGIGGLVEILVMNSFILGFFFSFILFTKQTSFLFLEILIMTPFLFSIYSESYIPIAIAENPVYLIGEIFGLVCIVGMIICIRHLSKRNEYGSAILGKIKGFKNFLETAEKPKLETLVASNPTYFYDILPFTYILGVSNKWISKFESISMSEPNWYHGNGSFNIVVFGNMMDRTMSNSTSYMSSNPNSSSSTGGGSSGGGSGGGGGSSW